MINLNYYSLFYVYFRQITGLLIQSMIDNQVLSNEFLKFNKFTTNNGRYEL